MLSGACIALLHEPHMCHMCVLFVWRQSCLGKIHREYLTEVQYKKLRCSDDSELHISLVAGFTPAMTALSQGSLGTLQLLHRLPGGQVRVLDGLRLSPQHEPASIIGI